MADETPADTIAASAERFARETEHHVLTILHDDGLYRHIRCMAPSPMGSAYWFELITVPGSLTFRGDGESFVFARLTDMFGFFRSNPDRNTMRISPDYWAEKLTSDRNAAKKYSPEVFARLVADELTAAEEEYPGVTAAWAEAIDLDYDTDYEENARPALEGFEYRPEGAGPRAEPFRFHNTYEWDLRDFDWWYLWACHAIVWGISQYDQAKQQEADVEPLTLAEFTALLSTPRGTLATVLLDGGMGDRVSITGVWNGAGIRSAPRQRGDIVDLHFGFPASDASVGPLREREPEFFGTQPSDASEVTR